MKTKLFLLAVALSSGMAMLNAQDAPKPPQAPGDPQAKGDEAFKRMDANGDGKVSKDEFMDFFKKEAEMRYNKMDASGSGFVTKEQFMEAMHRMHGGEGVPHRPDGFKKPDGAAGGTRPRPGGDNNVPDGKPLPPPQDGGPAKHGAIGEIFHKIQEDGSISKEEFSKISDEQFKRMDSNGDGKITKEEMEEFGKKMREGRGAPGAGPKGGAALQGNRPKPTEAN